MAFLGAADATAFTAVESLNDPTLDLTDFLGTTALSAGLAGGLGRIINPKYVGVVVKRGIVDVDDTADAMQNLAHLTSVHPHAPKSAGAAAVADQLDGSAARAAAGPDQITKASSPIGGDPLSPIGRMQTMSAVSVDTLEPKGFTSAAEAYTLANRVIPNRATNEAELLGVARAARCVLPK